MGGKLRILEQDYDAIFYIGGHGPVFDLPVDPVNIKLANEASDLSLVLLSRTS
jgi:putative intracellular protease/amidase